MIKVIDKRKFMIEGNLYGEMTLIKSEDLHVRQKALMIYYAWVKTRKE